MYNFTANSWCYWQQMTKLCWKHNRITQTPGTLSRCLLVIIINYYNTHTSFSLEMARLINFHIYRVQKPVLIGWKQRQIKSWKTSNVTRLQSKGICCPKYCFSFVKKSKIWFKIFSKSENLPIFITLIFCY